ncbi:MAG: Fur family transcriptional regulator [Chthoniobacteraceae bacterium]
MKAHPATSEDAITSHGIRLTPQRRYVYEALMEKRDHPTASEVFMRAKARMPSISLATVYNCLDALTESGLIRQVYCERGSSRYCPNLVPHGHFFCRTCGVVLDVPIDPAQEASWEFPEGTELEHVEITLRGLCPACAQKQTTSPL